MHSLSVLLQFNAIVFEHKLIQLLEQPRISKIRSGKIKKKTIARTATATNQG
jgi:hypothetical protein